MISNHNALCAVVGAQDVSKDIPDAMPFIFDLIIFQFDYNRRVID